jgi:hypothetical protein
MNKEEAKSILTKLLGEYRAKTYSQLLCLVRTQDISKVTTESGTSYQLEFQAVWDDKKNGNIRVIGAIDDGGLWAFMPLTTDFIIAPNGEFVGECVLSTDGAPSSELFTL